MTDQEKLINEYEKFKKELSNSFEPYLMPIVIWLDAVIKGITKTK